MGAIVWTGNIVEHRPYHVKASGVWMGAWPTRRRAIRHARRLLRNGWASVIIEDVRATASSDQPYKVGDPDPTPDAPGGTPCAARYRNATAGTAYCTWENGHDGPHVAGDGTIIVATWEHS